jgi:hypothetical protein
MNTTNRIIHSFMVTDTDPDLNILEHLKKGNTPKDKLSAIKNVLNLNPGSGTAADWFIEDGTATLNSLKKYNKSATKGLNMHAKTVVSNYLKSATETEKKTVGINDFVKRQTKPDFVGTKITTAQLDQLDQKFQMTL